MGDISDIQKQKAMADIERAMNSFLLEYLQFARGVHRWISIAEVTISRSHSDDITD